jgi:hypothetical protein
VPLRGMGGVLYATVWYGGTKLVSSLVWLIVAELGMLLSGSIIGGLITIAVSGLEVKVLMTVGAWLGVRFFDMPYEGFSNVSRGAEELGACGILETLYGSKDGLKVRFSLNHLLACNAIDLSCV